MDLSLAAPGMLIGLGLIVLPILAHVTGYQEVRTVAFPTLRFLRASQVRVRRRTRLESWLLLLLRALLVTVLALLFTRPDVSWTARSLGGIEPSLPTLLLLDRSASMTREGDGGVVFDQAVEEGRGALLALAPGTLAGVLLFDSSATLLEPGLTADHGRLARALTEARVGAGRTDLDGALRRARQVLRDASVERANVVVLSDGTASALPAGLAKNWPEGLGVLYRDLLGRADTNRWVQGASVVAGMQRGEGLRVRGRVLSTDLDPIDLRLALDLGEGVRASRELHLDGGEGEAVYSVPVPPAGQVAATLTLPPDVLAVDDTYSFVLSGDSDLDVLLVSGDGGQNPRDDEVYYLSRALQPGPGSPSRLRPREVAAEELRGIQGGRGDVIFLANVADPEPLAEDLERFLKAGGGVFLSLGARVDPDRYNAVLGDLLPARLTEVKTRGAGTFEQSPTGLALPPLDQRELQVFRTGGAAVFSRVRFGKLMGTEPRLQPHSRVILRTTDGLPALLERQVGAGRLVLFTSTVDDDWTDLPLRSIFPSLMHQFARGLSNTLNDQGGQEVDVGGTIRLPLPVAEEEEAWVVGPAGDVEPLARRAADEEGRVEFSRTDRPGAYRLIWGGAGGKGEERAVFTVRVPQDESRLRPLDRDGLLAAVPGLRYHRAGEEERSEDSATVIRSASLAPWLAGASLLLALAEGLLAGRRP